MIISRYQFLSKPCQALRYSTLPSKAAGKFTSNKLINGKGKHAVNEVQRTLVYLGPFSETMKRYKMTASFFGVCGLIAVPGLASTGQAPLLSVALAGISALSPAVFVHFYTRGYVTKLIVYDDIKNVEKERRRPKEMKDKYIGLETISFWGRFKEQNMWLSELKHKSTTKGLVWEQKTGAKSIFTLEREIMEADPYLNALVKRVQKKEA